MGYLFILGTVLTTVYGQIAIKWGVSQRGGLPGGAWDNAMFLFGLVFDPWIFSGLLAAFVGALFWLAALTRFQLSFAYPFMSLSFVLVLVLSALVLHEPLNIHKIAGVALIVAGIVVSSRGLG
ncbi:putative membrane protein [Desulfobaculum xiamenense]|uniref:Putative membrane protein n=1 Tax=Desulfobaculum xiamenense TaxID=995050 RepID=A0A846QQF0_9BACT|nr:EamA family transporter [Desulfobaculum xiamenense]NJB69210.1 putative membrane protein [Desulfobaculum xiamenense]